MTLERGAFLHKRYRILEILGQGGMGSLYRAIDDNLGVEVAVKENLFTTDEYARQFRREAIILANLRHPNLPRVSDHFVIEGQGQYLIMDYIEGEDLRERMDRQGAISEAEAIVIGVSICDAMAYMHSQRPPVLHRDIKPGNVRIAPDGHVYLVDFGLAKVVQGGQQTTTGARAMTPGYSPPEQYGAARTDHRSDIYALGATLYAALSGSIPEDSLARTMEQVDLTPLRKINPKVSRRLESIIEKALAVHPDNRFQGAEEFRQALLSARSNTLRRLAEQGNLPSESAELNGSIRGGDSAIPIGPQKQLASLSEESSVLLPTSTTLDEIDYASTPKKKKKRGGGCLVSALMIGVLLIIAGAMLYGLYPQAFSQLLAAFPQWQLPGFAPTPTSAQGVAGDPGGAISATPQPEATATVLIVPGQPSLTATVTPSVEPSLTPTKTRTPTPTIPPIPTLQGGGQGEIAFASITAGLPQIWIIDADGNNLRQVTAMQQGACQPDWSPDGARLVFVSPCEDNQEIYRSASLYLINADGSGLVALPSEGGGDFDPDWSPDGERILFTSLREERRPQIFVIELADYVTRRLSDGEKWDLQAVWSSDGAHIVFVSTRKGPYQIWLMNADGSNPERFSASGDNKNTYPDWSPDGFTIVFTQNKADGVFPRVVAARYPGGGDNVYDLYPASIAIPLREATHSSDGTWLVLESWPEGSNHNIYLMPLNGDKLTPLTVDLALDFDPVWRPALP